MVFTSVYSKKEGINQTNKYLFKELTVSKLNAVVVGIHQTNKKRFQTKIFIVIRFIWTALSTAIRFKEFYFKNKKIKKKR